MKQIFKYPIEPYTEFITMPQGAKILHVAEQCNELFLWAEVDETQPPATRKIICVGTGMVWDEEEMKLAEYIGTVQQDGFVWHYYDGFQQ